LSHKNWRDKLPLVRKGRASVYSVFSVFKPSKPLPFLTTEDTEVTGIGNEVSSDDTEVVPQALIRNLRSRFLERFDRFLEAFSIREAQCRRAAVDAAHHSGEDAARAEFDEKGFAFSDIMLHAIAPAN